MRFSRHCFVTSATLRCNLDGKYRERKLQLKRSRKLGCENIHYRYKPWMRSGTCVPINVFDKMHLTYLCDLAYSIGRPIASANFARSIRFIDFLWQIFSGKCEHWMMSRRASKPGCVSHRIKANFRGEIESITKIHGCQSASAAALFVWLSQINTSPTQLVTKFPEASLTSIHVVYADLHCI